VNKKILLSVLILTFSGLAMAQTVEIEDSDDFPTELTGGESFELGLDYSVNADREVPLSLELSVSSEEFDVPEEAFTVSVEENEAEFDDGVYRVDLDDSSEDGSVVLGVDSSSRLKSGNYDFTLDLLSSVGVGQKLDSVDVLPEEAAEVAGERSQVTVRAFEEGSASVTELDFVGANPPSDNSEFIGGVEVDVQNDEGDDIGSESSGTVRVNFDEDDIDGLDRDSLSVYFYNESSSEWEALDSTVGDDFVEAEVDHFSVYTVYGEEESDDGSSSSTSITIPDIDEAPEEAGEDGAEESQEGGEGQQPEDADGQDQQEEGEEESQEEGSEIGTPGESQPPSGLTGQFVEQASNPVTAVILVLVGLITAGIYTGRIQALANRVREIQ